ncbi:MAG: hypothetical protein ABSB22_04775 [Thermodesulfobacteriota bacterium]
MGHGSGGRSFEAIQRVFREEAKICCPMSGRKGLGSQKWAEEEFVKDRRGCHCPHPTEVTIEKEGESKKKMISVGHRGIKLPFDQQELYWVVVKGLGEKPMMLLTHVNAKSLGGMRVLEIYLTRWKCEESYRFIKQAYQLEDVRVLSYTALRNRMVLVQAVFYFVSAELGKKLKLNILLKKSLRRPSGFLRFLNSNSTPLLAESIRYSLALTQEFSLTGHPDKMVGSSYSLLQFNSLKNILGKVQRDTDQSP